MVKTFGFTLLRAKNDMLQPNAFLSLRKMPGALSGEEFYTGIWFQQTLSTDLHTKNKQNVKCRVCVCVCVNTADGNTD